MAVSRRNMRKKMEDTFRKSKPVQNAEQIVAGLKGTGGNSLRRTNIPTEMVQQSFGNLNLIDNKNGNVSAFGLF
jgi:hypothetical protein